MATRARSAVAALQPSDLRSDLWAGLKQGVLLAAAALVLTLPPGPDRAAEPGSGLPRHRRGTSFTALTSPPRRPPPTLASSPTGSPIRATAAAFPSSSSTSATRRVFVFGAQGRLIDSSPVLLGATPGDDSVADIGTRPMASVREDEKTTPAGRFVAQAGKNASHEDVVWVDYTNAVSMHRVRLVDPKERRLERLASPDPAERRISYGCINVPVAFFDTVVWPLLRSTRAVVYVLPEVRDVHEVFAAAYPVPARPRAGRHDRSASVTLVPARSGKS